MGARFAGCLADSRSVCRPEVPPFVENIAPERVQRVRTLARCWHVASHEVSVGRFAEPQEKEDACRLASANANGKVGSQVSDPDGSSSLLGLVC